MTGLLFSAWVVVLMLLNFSTTINVRGHATNGLAAIALYLIGGSISGAIVGAMFPLMRSWAGAVLTGIVACIPLAFGLGFMISGGYSGIDVVGPMAVFAVMFGALMGVMGRATLMDHEKS